MDQFEQATQRAERRRVTELSAMSARYDPERDRVVIELSGGGEFAFFPHNAQGLEKAKLSDLDIIEISPSGFGLYFPKLDVDLWLPALMQGVFGSRKWMAAQLGARGGKVKSKAKAKAARENGKLGGRPRTRRRRRSARPHRHRKRA